MPKTAPPGAGGAHGPGAPDPDTAAEGSAGAAAEVDLVLSALADPTRRQILDLLGRGRALNASVMAETLPISRQAVVQHLAVLQRSGLVSARKVGREVLFSVRPEALTGTASWMNTLAATWTQRLALLKQAAEQPPAPPPQTR